MAKRELIGTMVCPECGFPHAEVKRQKNEALAYRFCTECHAQYFARTPETTARLIAKTGNAPVTVTEKTDPAPAIDPVPEPKPPVSVPVPTTKRGGMAEALELMGIRA